MGRRSGAVEPELLAALAHPLRLRIMQAAGDGFSAKRLADAFGDASIQLISYHVRALRDAGLLELTGTQQRRGAVEHFYRLSPDAAQRLYTLGTSLASLGESLGGRPGRRARRS